jgi:hypothetical protein
VQQLVEEDLRQLIHKCIETIPGQTSESIARSVQATAAALEVLEDSLKPPSNQ